MSDLTEDDFRHITHITQRLEEAFKYLYGYVPTQNNQVQMYMAYREWQAEVNMTSLYNCAMWAATNRDLLAEWVLEYCICEWGM